MDNNYYFGNWQIEKLLGSGSFGDVYKIKKEDFGVTYYSAMKTIIIPQDKSECKRLMSSGMSASDLTDYYTNLVQDFINEIELMAKLQGHTNIVGYNDHLIEPNEDGVGYKIYIRMEYLTPLDSYLIDDGKPRFMSEKEVAKLGIDICSALEVCSKMHIIHRDIKPENIFISENGDFKLGDFGIAKKLQSTKSDLSRKGTMNYMAPEVYKGESYTESVDIYSLGIVLYRLLNCNRIPFFPLYPEVIKHSDAETAFTKRISGEAIPPIADVSEDFNRIIIKACEFDANNRYQSASELKEDLQKIYSSLSGDSKEYINEKTPEDTPEERISEKTGESSLQGDEGLGKTGTVILPENELPSTAPPTDNNEIAPEKAKLSKKIIIIAAVAVLIVVGVIAALISSGSSKEDETTSISTTQTTTEPTTESTTETTTETTTESTTKKQKSSSSKSKKTYNKTTSSWDENFDDQDVEYVEEEDDNYYDDEGTESSSSDSESSNIVDGDDE